MATPGYSRQHVVRLVYGLKECTLSRPLSFEKSERVHHRPAARRRNLRNGPKFYSSWSVVGLFRRLVGRLSQLES